MAVNFDDLLMGSASFLTTRATELLREAGFIQGIAWDGSSWNKKGFSIKLPTDGYIEIVLEEKDSNRSIFKSIVMRDRTGKEVPGMSSDFNVAREVLAFVADWDNKAIGRYAFWHFTGQVAFSNFAYLWYGAVDSAEKWVGLASTKFYPTPERVKVTMEKFKDKISR